MSEYPFLVKSIKKHGMLKPIEIDASGKIQDGWMRYLAAIELGLVFVPVRDINMFYGLIHIFDLASANPEYLGDKVLPKSVLKNGRMCWVYLDHEERKVF